MNSHSLSDTEGAVLTISNAFEEALVRFGSWKTTRKNRRSGESELQDSLEAGRDDLKSYFNKLKDEHGTDFENGDGM